VTLLELTRDLLDLYANRQQPHVPVVLNLSTWRRKTGGMLEWATEELVTTYYVPRLMARQWLNSGRLLLMLDGLDEVPEDERDACVNALNRFLADFSPPGVAVACRSAEYAALTERLRLYTAIRLQPLDDQQVDAYVAQGGAALATLRTLLAGNETLRTLARTPLMLAVMSLAMHGAPSSGLDAPAVRAGDVGETQLRDQIFALYASRMFARRQITGDMAHRLTHQFSWLATSMQRQASSIFWIERLQPAWLRVTPRRLAYGLLSPAVVTLLFTLALVTGTTLVVTNDLTDIDWKAVRGSAAVLLLSMGSGAIAADLLRCRLGLSAEGHDILERTLSFACFVLYFAIASVTMILWLGTDEGLLSVFLFAVPFGLVYGSRSASRSRELGRPRQ